MPNAEPHRLSATEMVGRIEAGSLTAEAVVHSCLERIRDREPVVRAWAHIAADAALGAARSARRDTLMKGIPFGIKDIFDTAEMPTGYGSPIVARHCWSPVSGSMAITRPLRSCTKSCSPRCWTVAMPSFGVPTGR